MIALVLAVFVSTMVAGGLSVRSLIRSSFQDAEHVRATRALALETLKLQLDEETGIRGFAATRETAFLDPYRKARPQLAAATTALRSAVADLGISVALSSIDDAAATNARWLQTVAEPIASGSSRDSSALQRRGKVLVDHYRDAVANTDAALARREAVIDKNAESAIDRIILLAGAFTAVVFLLTMIFGGMQRRTTRRLDYEREQAEEQRRTAAGLRAAYLAEKRIADTLQDAFSQRPLPTLPSLRFSAMYVPATEEARVGGDWYDALQLPGNRVMFAIGDVTGHGLDAAVGMSRARQELIAAAMADPEPASVLRRVNAELIRQGSPLVTAVVGYADAERHEFVYSIAGHPPPLLLEPGHSPRMLDCGALPLAALGDAEFETYRVPVSVGSLLVLYTDGAVEHSRNVLDGETLLLDAAARAMASGNHDVAAVMHGTIFEGNDAGDDVAILTIGFAEETEDGVTVSASHAKADFAGRIGGTVEPAADPITQRGRFRTRRSRWVHPEVLAS